MILGSLQFQRPVIFYNHADHGFWLGASIADIVADLRVKGQRLTQEFRGVKDSFLLGIPTDMPATKSQFDKTLAREKLSLPKDKKIVLTIDSAY